jgi:hypothetical protein
MGLELKKIYLRILQKLNNLAGTPESVAHGFATGSAMSFTPFVGFHLILSLFVAKVFKQNEVAAALGTLVGNPWSFPFIWYATFKIGNIVLKNDGIEAPADFKMFFNQLFHAILSMDFDAFFTEIWPVFYSMLIGSVPFFIVAWMISSYIMRKILIKSKKRG